MAAVCLMFYELLQLEACKCNTVVITFKSGHKSERCVVTTDN